MEHRHQRGALAAGGDIAAAQVADHVDGGQFGQQRAVEQLHRVAAAVVQAGLMAHRLTMCADRADRRSRRGALLEQPRDHLGIGPGHRIGGQRAAVQLVGAAGLQRHQLFTPCRRKRLVHMCDQCLPAAVGADAAQHAVDPVERGARHQADEELAVAHSMRWRRGTEALAERVA